MSKLPSKSEKKSEKAERFIIEEHIGGFFLCVMLILSFINIVSRVISGFSFAFTEEITVYLFVCSTFFGISAGVVHDLHLSVTLVTDIFKKKKWWNVELAVEILNIIAVYAMFVLLAKFSFDLCVKQIKYEYATPVLQLPTWIFTSSMFFGSILFLYRSTVKFIANIKRILKKEDEKENLVFDGVELELDKIVIKEDENK